MKQKRYIGIALIVVIACASLLSGRTTFNNFKRTFFPDSQNNDVIRVGVLQPLTGTYKMHGNAQLEGILLANKLKPEVAGKKIEIVEADSQGSVYVAESAIADLIDKDPTLVIGSCGDAVTLTAAKEFEKAKIPAITATATNPMITENHSCYFRLSFSDADQANVVAGYILNGLNQKKAAIVRTEGDISSSEMVRTFKKTFKAGLDEPTSDSIMTIDLAIKDNNYDSYIRKIKKAGIKSVFAPVSIEESEKLFKAAEKLKADDIVFIGPESWHTDEMNLIKAKYPKITVLAAADMASDIKESKEYEKFVKAFKKEYGKMPDEENARAYDAYMVAAEGLEKSKGKGGKSFIDALMSLEGFPAVTGRISFNKRGEAVKQINIDSLENDKWKTVFTVDN